jgi:predicted acylesterase/phospholipase RssA
MPSNERKFFSWEESMALFDLVFEGGGAKGSAFVGALTALAENGHTIRRLIGTSAGAITAATVAAGYSPGELVVLVNEKVGGKPRFATFMDRPAAASFTDEEKDKSATMRALHMVRFPMFADREILHLLLDTPVYPHLFSFVECGGLFSGDAFLAWITEKLAAKGIAATDTMKTFFSKKNVDLSVVTSDTTDGEMLVINHRTAPDVPVTWAVRMSMSIPFVWREVVWQENWGRYQGRPKAGNIMVDGGVLSNFPIRLIAESVPDIMGDTDPNAALNLGLLLDEQLPKDPIARSSPAAPAISEEPLGVVRRVSCLIDTMMGAADNDGIRKRSAEICRLPVKGVGTIEFNMSDQKLQALIKGAHDAVAAHLEGRGLSKAAAATK